jgi:hypothetical protein
MKRLASVLLAVPLLLTGCVVPYGGSSPTTTATDQGTAVADLYSTLDADGIAHIKQTKAAQLDMTSGRLSKDSVGLRSGASEAPDVKITGGTMHLTIDAPYGLITTTTDRLRMNGMNSGPDFSEVTYFLTANSREDYFSLIREGVGRYGIPSDSAEDWITSISARPQDKSDFAIQPGTSTGLEVTYDLRYDGAKDVQVIIVHVSPLASNG